MPFTSLAITNTDELIYGKSPKPVTTKNSGMVIGGGTLYPELNFTVPPMTLSEATRGEMLDHYKQIVREALKRAAELESPGVVLECETVPPQTQNPSWTKDICDILLSGMKDAQDKWGLKSALRFTPNDNRDMIRPPQMRSGKEWDAMMECFDIVTKMGADMVSIESIGGKETHDEALIKCDIEQVIFSLAILAARDMKFLWTTLVDKCNKTNTIPAGDSSCGFANTAMVLAEQKLIPRSFGALVRILSTVRAIVAIECGAKGPSKDCAYENPFLKIITGTPASGEGKTAACAHLSRVGNIAAAYTDLWSNESVQNIMLLGSTAPTACMEMLIYDCRLMNEARKEGFDLKFRNLLIESDAALDPHAFIFRPENVLAVGKTYVENSSSPYKAAKALALMGAKAMLAGGAAGKVKFTALDKRYMEKVVKTVEAMPADENEFIAKMMKVVDTTKFDPKGYGL